jgi:endo-1,4-beta-D-glucanase Y
MNDICDMSDIKKILIPVMLLSLKGQVNAQIPRKPFPQHVQYYAGVIRPTHISQEKMDDSVRVFYTRWKKRYIHKGCREGEYYVWFERPKRNIQCVSEGQGYGMIIVTLMAGFDSTAKKTFDGLWAYYKSHPSKRNPHLMAWAQTKKCKDLGRSSATDGDLDIAYSLLLANAQWGSEGPIKYLEEGRELIKAIMEQEINSQTYSVLLSNAVENDSKDYFDMRSSDFMPAHFRAFKLATGEGKWDKVMDNNYRLFSYLQKQYSDRAGLFPDFINHINKKPEPSKPRYLESKHDGSYNYNACRIPWRIATDFILNGDKRAFAIVEKINNWIRASSKNNPYNISAGYTLDGNSIRRRNYEAMSFIAPFAVSAMVNAKHQQWLNKIWDYMLSFRISQFDYYDNSIKMFDLIIISGNYWVPDK